MRLVEYLAGREHDCLRAKLFDAAARIARSNARSIHIGRRIQDVFIPGTQHDEQLAREFGLQRLSNLSPDRSTGGYSR